MWLPSRNSQTKVESHAVVGQIRKAAERMRWKTEKGLVIQMVEYVEKLQKHIVENDLRKRDSNVIAQRMADQG